MEIRHCPSCGSGKITKARGPVTREFEGAAYTVPDVTYHACPECGEHVYDGEAVDKIQAASATFRKVLSAK